MVFKVFVTSVRFGLITEKLVDRECLLGVACHSDIRLVIESKEPQMVTHLLLELAGILLRMWVVLNHLKNSILRQVERTVRENIKEIIKPVSKGLTVLNNNAPILPICKVILAQIGPCDQNIVVKHMRLDVMNSEYLPQWGSLGVLALEDPCVWMVPEAYPDVAAEKIALERHQ